VRILIVHNAYQQAGGEDAVVSAEKALLEQAGNDVSEYLRHNDEITGAGGASNIALGLQTVWSAASRSELHQLLEKCTPDVVHFHNTFPLISPAAYYACRDLSIPVVQTLHNYRLLCPSAAFFRDGRVCEDCLEKSRWQGVRHACYRQSHKATAAVAAMQSFHQWYGTWDHLIDCYIALSEFSRAKFIQGGLPAQKLVVKPNFVLPDPGVGVEARDSAVFVGRLSEEKGPRTLLQAWAQVNTKFELRVIGDGPLHDELRLEIGRLGLSNVQMEGRLSRDESLKAIGRARFLILPSNCYENFPMTIAEAFASGTPVIASRLGAMREIVDDGRTGLHFIPGDATDLAAKIEWAWAHADEMRIMGRNARAEYEGKYTADRNYKMLIEIYQRAIEQGQRTLAEDADHRRIKPPFAGETSHKAPERILPQ
jgi:glycosyltransferase involved in cell wall biosynthesis